MLSYNEIRENKVIDLDGEPYTVLSSHVFRKQQRKPVNQTKLKSLISGRVVERSFNSSEKVEEADIEKKEFLYTFKKYNRQTNSDEYWFTDPQDKGNRFPLPQDILGQQITFLKENELVSVQYFNEKPIGIEIPIKMTFTVTDAPPNVKGNTAQGGNKQVVIETGATITTPMFIETGDKIVVNTQTSEYAERAKE